MSNTQQVVNDIQLALAGSSPMVNATMKRGARKLLEKCTDMVDRLLRDYKSRLLDELGNPFMTEDGKAVVFPEGTKFFSHYQGNTVVVVEEKPRIRTVLFDGFQAQESYDRDSFQLAFPYFIYIMSFARNSGKYHFAGLQVGYRNDPLTSNEDEIFTCNLPNITDMSVCLNWGRDDSNIAKLCEQCITNFWSSHFNNDGTENWCAMAKKDKRLTSPEAWERASLADPLFVLQVNWHRSHQILRQVVVEETQPDDNEVNEFLQRLISQTFARCVESLPLSEVEKTLSTALRDTVAIAVKEAVLKSAK